MGRERGWIEGDIDGDVERYVVREGDMEERFV